MSGIMPSVAISTRQVVNKETGLDLYVQGEQQSVVSKRTIRTIVYHVIVVSNLTSFSATEGNTIHYALEVNHNDMQKLHGNLCKKFSGTLIPDIPDKPISFIDTAKKKRERMKQCEVFLQFCARTLKIAHSEYMMKFLGQNKSAAAEDESEHGEQEKIENEPSEKHQATREELFGNAIPLSKKEIFSNDEEDDNFPAFTSSSAVAAPQNYPVVDSNRPSAQLYKESHVSGDNTGQATNKTADANAHTENASVELEGSDDEFESLMARLDNAKLARAKHEEKWIQRKKEIEHRNSNISTDKEDHSIVEVENIGYDDVSKYIAENSGKSENNYEFDF